MWTDAIGNRPQKKRGPAQIWPLERLFFAKLESAKFTLATRLTYVVHGGITRATHSLGSAMITARPQVTWTVEKS